MCDFATVRRARLQRRCRPRGTHRSWNAAIKAAHGNGPGGGEMVDPAAPRYKWRRLSEDEARAFRGDESDLRRAAETAAGEAAGQGAAPPEALCAVDLMGVLQPLARAAAGLSLAGMDLAATRQRAYAALRSFGAAYRGVSASRLGQELCRAQCYDLIPEMAGGVTPLGRIGVEAMRRVGVEASRSLKRGELEAVLGDTARAAADLKTAEAAGAGGASARAGGESEPAARPFAGLGKEKRQTESLGFIASNVCSFGLGVRSHFSPPPPYGVRSKV